MNDVTLSADRRQMTIISPDGLRRAELRSELPGGFTAEHELYALTSFTWATGLGKHVTRRRLMFGRWVYLHTNIGPPAWWLPRVWVEHNSADRGHWRVGGGWLRLAVSLAWEDHDE